MGRLDRKVPDLLRGLQLAPGEKLPELVPATGKRKSRAKKKSAKGKGKKRGKRAK